MRSSAQTHLQQAELARRIAHALRGPLSVMTGALEMDADGAAAQRVRALGQRAGRQLQRIADRLGLYARVVGNELSSERTRVDPRAVVEAAVADVSAVRVRRGVEVELGAFPSVAVAGHAASLQAALAELVDNAIRHAARRVTVHAALEAGSQLCIWVVDDGPGPSPSRCADPGRVFGDDADGTGLAIGLHLAVAIITAHAGSLRMEASSGARVGVRLPIADAAPD